MTTEQAIRYFEGFKSEIPELIQEQHARYDDTDDFDMEMREQSEATDLALFALRSQQWISVKDRMPEKLEPVNIVWVNRQPERYYADIKDKPFVATGVYCNDKWWWFSATHLS